MPKTLSLISGASGAMVPSAEEVRVRPRKSEGNDLGRSEGLPCSHRDVYAERINLDPNWASSQRLLLSCSVAGDFEALSTEIQY